MAVIRTKKVNVFFIGVVTIAVLLCCCGSAMAAQEGDYKYAVTAGQARITDYLGTGGGVVVPSVLGGFPVTSIGDGAFADCSDLIGVTIPEGVSSIGERAFSNCSSLTSVSLPDTLALIGNRAFENCTSLTAIVIPKQAALAGSETFEGCTNLTSITFRSAATTYDQAYRRIMTGTGGYSTITATVTLPSRDKAADLDITSNNGAASYNYFGCQRKDNDSSDFDFEFGFGFKPCENNMMQFGIYYSIKAGSGENAVRDWRWLRPETGDRKFYAFDYGTTHQIQLSVLDGKIRAAIHDEDGNLEYSGSWSFSGPVENGLDQSVRRVTSLLVPVGRSASAKNYFWTSTNVGSGSGLNAANPSNCRATTFSSGDGDWVMVKQGSEYFQETVSFDIN